MQLAGFNREGSQEPETVVGILPEDARSFYERLFVARGALLLRGQLKQSVQTANKPKHAPISVQGWGLAIDDYIAPKASSNPGRNTQAASPSDPHLEQLRGDHYANQRPLANTVKAGLSGKLPNAPTVDRKADRQILGSWHPVASPTAPEPLSRNLAAAAGPMPQYGISRGNVGFRLLQKAGWKEGKGLGRDEQGLQIPLEKSSQVGRQGLGKSKAAAAAKQNVSKCQQLMQEGAGVKDKSRRWQHLDKIAKHKAKVARLVLPEDSETFDAKIKRHRQRQLSEVEAARGKAISRYINTAFGDDPGTTPVDDNPLLRRSRLTAVNPLL